MKKLNLRENCGFKDPIFVEDLIKELEKYPKNAVVSIPHEHFGCTTDFDVYYNEIINQVF